MNKKHNCRFAFFDCPHLLTPMYHSGFTGKSGIETYWYCEKLVEPIRDINKCGVGKAYYEVYKAKNDI